MNQNNPTNMTLEAWAEALQAYCKKCEFFLRQCQFDTGCVNKSSCMSMYGECEINHKQCHGKYCKTPEFARHFMRKYAKMEVMNKKDENFTEKEPFFVEGPAHKNMVCLAHLKEVASQEEYLSYLRLSAIRCLWKTGPNGPTLETLKDAREYVEHMIRELEEK